MRKKGLEPSRLATQEPKSCTSANSVISANKPHKNLNLACLPIPPYPQIPEEPGRLIAVLPLLHIIIPFEKSSCQHKNRVCPTGPRGILVHPTAASPQVSPDNPYSSPPEAPGCRCHRGIWTCTGRSGGSRQSSPSWPVPEASAGFLRGSGGSAGTFWRSY